MSKAHLQSYRPVPDRVYVKVSLQIVGLAIAMMIVGGFCEVCLSAPWWIAVLIGGIPFLLLTILCCRRNGILKLP